MSREEYLQLLERSVSFKTLDAYTRERMKNAEGAEMKENIKFFQEEAMLVDKACKKFVDKTEQVVINLKYQAAKNKRNKKGEKERQERVDESSKLENLITNI